MECTNKRVTSSEWISWICTGEGKDQKTVSLLGYDNVPNFEDFGLGCFLLAGSEVYKLSKSMEPKEKEPKKEKEASQKVKKEKR